VRKTDYQYHKDLLEIGDRRVQEIMV